MRRTMTGVLLIALGLFALGCGSSPAKSETASVSPSPSPRVLTPAQPNTSASSPWRNDGTWAHDLPVHNVRDYGAVGDGVTNDTPALMSAVAASTTRGGVIYFPPGKTYLLGSKIRIPVNLTNWMVFSGYGATLRVTSGSQGGCFGLPLGSTVEGDIARYLVLEGFHVDGNGRPYYGSGTTHPDILIGNHDGGSSNFHGVGWAHIRIHDVVIDNVTPNNGTYTDRVALGVDLANYAKTVPDGTKVRCDDIAIENVRMTGGDSGILVGIAGTDCEVGDIRITNFHYDRGVAPSSLTAYVAGSGIMLTSNHTGRVAIHDCYVRGISDTAYELDGIADLSMKNCVAADDPQIGFYFMNNRTGESEGQKYVLENCVVETKTNQASTGRYNYGGAFRIWALTVPFGDLVMNNCVVKNQLGATIVSGTSSIMPMRMEGYIRSLSVRGFSVRYTSLNATALTGNVCLGSLLTLQGRTAADRTPTELTIDGFHYYVQGKDPTSGTAGLEGPIFHFWKATNNVKVDMRNLDIKCDITNAKRPMEVFAVDGGTYGSFNVDGLTMHGAAIGAPPGG